MFCYCLSKFICRNTYEDDLGICKYLISFFFVSGVDSWYFVERLLQEHSTDFIEEGERSWLHCYRGAQQDGPIEMTPVQREASRGNSRSNWDS